MLPDRAMRSATNAIGSSNMIGTYVDKLSELLCSGPGADWLDAAFVRLEKTDHLFDELVTLSAMARRKLGDDVLVSGAHPIATPSGAVDAGRLQRGDAGRIALMLKAISVGLLAADQLIADMYRLGDEYEKAAIIRGLALLSDSDSLKPVALQCGRTNNIELFTSLAIENPYPAVFYNQHEYNQLVLKALFMGVNIEGVIGLDKRANAALSSMCENYVNERIAAGRVIPADIWLALAPFASPAGERLLIEHASHDDRLHRYYALRGIHGRLSENPDLVDVLNDCRAREADEALTGVLLKLHW
jgi:hypothetical protein